MAQTQMNAKDLSGFNVYHTKNQTIYWDIYSKTAFIISQSDVSSFSTWQLRLPLTIMLAMILVLFGMTYAFSFLVALAIYLVAEIIFRVKYLPTLPVSLKWQKPKSEGFIKDTAIKFNFSSIVVIAVMFVAFAAMFIIDIIGFSGNTSATIIYSILTAISIIGCLVTIKIAIERKKMDKANKK